MPLDALLKFGPLTPRARRIHCFRLGFMTFMTFMTFYFTLKSIPELTQLPAGLRWRAWLVCVPKTFRHWQTWLACAAAGMSILVFFVLLTWFAPSSLVALAESSPTFWLPIILTGVGVAVVSAPSILVFSHIQSEVIRPYLKEYLASGSKSIDDTTS